MEAIILVGLPGSGKSSFYKERFFNSHVRISLDLLGTRHRQMRFVKTCLETDQRFVVDDTNPTRAARSRFIQAVRAARAPYQVVGYYFQATVDECLRRNADRAGAGRVPDVAIRSAARKLEVPSLDEGFDQLFRVRLSHDGFKVDEWDDEA